MSTKKHKLPFAIAGVCIIGLIGFKDTGIFVKDFTAIDKEEAQISFEKHEEVKVFREDSEGYLVQKNGVVHNIPMDAMIRTSRKTENYNVINDISMTDKPIAGNNVKTLKKGEIVEILSYQGDYGIFKAEDGTQGYIKFTDVEVVVEDKISYGISKVDKVIKNEEAYYTLVKGESVFIRDFKDNNYIIVDKEGKEFKVKEDYIQLRRKREMVSRGTAPTAPNRGETVTKVVEAAYKNIGKSYVHAGIGPNGFDCSGLTYSIYLNELGIKLNRSSRDQVKNGVEVSRKDLIPGDLVFFRTSGTGIGHVGLYIGDGNMIHASSGQNRVMITNINESKYYNTRYVGGRRIIK